MDQIRLYRLKRDYADLMWPVCAIEEIKTNDDGIMKSLRSRLISCDQLGLSNHHLIDMNINSC